jgi:hypothetical protein
MARLGLEYQGEAQLGAAGVAGQGEARRDGAG